MARRRLQTILATTVLAAGLSVAPASAQTLSDLTDGVEETTDAVEDTVDQTTDTVDETVEKTTNAVEDATTGSSGSDDSDDSGGSNDDSSNDDGGGGDLGSTVEDTTKTVTDTVDETVEKTTDTVEDTTKAVTDAVDSTSPDDSDPDGDTGDDGGEGTSGTGDTGNTGGSRNLPIGNDVVAAGSDGSRTAQDPNATSSGGSLAEALAAFGALGRSGSSNTDLAGGTTSSTDVPAPQVADPNTEPFDEFAGSSDVEKPAVMASGPADPTDSSAALLKVFAALLVLGTGVTAKRAVEQA